MRRRLHGYVLGSLWVYLFTSCLSVCYIIIIFSLQISVKYLSLPPYIVTKEGYSFFLFPISKIKFNKIDPNFKLYKTKFVQNILGLTLFSWFFPGTHTEPFNLPKWGLEGELKINFARIRIVQIRHLYLQLTKPIRQFGKKEMTTG